MTKEDLYLAFVAKIGEDSEGKNIYRFDFTEAPDIVWGEGWNIIPCSIIPNLAPDKKTISATARMVSEKEYRLAKDNSCFSMQDCIDGVISLLFTTPRDMDELILDFGEKYEDVEKELSNCGLELTDFEEVRQNKENEIIDDTLNILENIKNDEDDLDF